MEPLHRGEQKHEKCENQREPFITSADSIGPPDWSPPPVPLPTDRLASHQPTRKDSLPLPTRSPSNASSRSEKLISGLKHTSSKLSEKVTKELNLM